MREFGRNDWQACSQALAFLGNSLLAPISQTADVGLDPAFWKAFPTFGDADVEAAAVLCADFAHNCQAEPDIHWVQRVSVEYTRLFIGPPRPVAPPWETFYRSEGASVGFGAATFEMRELLREAGLRVSNENNQYADHLGIELLYASVLSQRVADGNASADELAAFMREHLLAWIGPFRKAVAMAAPDGYYDCLLTAVAAICGLFA